VPLSPFAPVLSFYSIPVVLKHGAGQGVDLVRSSFLVPRRSLFLSTPPPLPQPPPFPSFLSSPFSAADADDISVQCASCDDRGSVPLVNAEPADRERVARRKPRLRIDALALTMGVMYRPTRTSARCCTTVSAGTSSLCAAAKPAPRSFGFCTSIYPPPSPPVSCLISAATGCALTTDTDRLYSLISLALMKLIQVSMNPLSSRVGAHA
jgi:hypothetical protein